MKILAILALASACAFAQPSEVLASRDAGKAAEAQHNLSLAKGYLESRSISRETFQRSEKEYTATLTTLRGKWQNTPYSIVFEREFKRALQDIGQGKPFVPLAPPTEPGQGLNNILLVVIVGVVVIFALAVVIQVFFGTNTKEEPAPPAKPGGPPPLSTNFGTAAYVRQILTFPSPASVGRGVFFGKSSGPEANGSPLNQNLGAPIISNAECHTIIVAKTRTGKGTRICVPTLTTYRGGSMLVIDPKGENAAITARQRQAVGGVHVINPWAELAPTFKSLGITSACYNPLDILDRNDPNAVSIAQALAGAVCPKDAKGKDSYWTDSAASVLTAVLLWLTDQPGEKKTLARAREMISTSRADFTKNYLAKMAASSAFSGAIRENAAPFVDLAPETYSGVMSNLSQHTRFLSDPQVKAATEFSSFSMSDLAETPTTVYLVIPPDRIDTQKTWLRLLITAGMATFKREQHRVRCMFLIDEFPALGNIPELPREIATMAGYGVDFTLIIQGLDQLKDIYGDAHNTILSNCAYKWFCNVSDLQSAEWLSKTLGKATVRTVGKSESKNPIFQSDKVSNESTSYSETGRELLKPDEILNLGRDTAILLHPTTNPHYLRPVDYWQLDKAFPGLYQGLKFDPNPYHVNGS